MLSYHLIHLSFVGLGHIGCTIGRHIHSLGLIFVFGQVFLRAGIGNHYLWAYSNM